jgi:hypothetical protein
MTRTEARLRRARYIRLRATAIRTRSRLIFHRKKGEHAYKLRKLYIRQNNLAQRARHSYLQAKVELHKPLGLKALDVARGLMGTVEHGGNNTGPEVDKIIRANGGDIGESWCGDFVAYCFKRAGSKSVSRSWAAAWAGVWGWMTGVKRVDPKDIRPGDIVEYEWQHTGIAETEPDHAGNFNAAEGNTGTQGNTSDTTADGVHSRTRNINQVKGAFRVLR